MTTILTIISAFVILPPYITQHAYLLYHLALFNFSNLILCKAKLVIRLPVHPFPLCLYAYIYFKSFPRKKKNSLAFTIVAHWIRCSHWPYIKLTCPFRCRSLNLEHKLVFNLHEVHFLPLNVTSNYHFSKPIKIRTLSFSCLPYLAAFFT